MVVALVLPLPLALLLASVPEMAAALVVVLSPQLDLRGAPHAEFSGGVFDSVFGPNEGESPNTGKSSSRLAVPSTGTTESTALTALVGVDPLAAVIVVAVVSVVAAVVEVAVVVVVGLGTRVAVVVAVALVVAVVVALVVALVVAVVAVVVVVVVGRFFPNSKLETVSATDICGT